MSPVRSIRKKRLGRDVFNVSSQQQTPDRQNRWLSMVEIDGRTLNERQKAGQRLVYHANFGLGLT